MMSRLLPILLILAAVGLFFGYINPTYTGSIASLRGDIASYDSALAASKQFSEKEAELAQERNSIPPEGLARIEEFLPDGVDNVQLILDLNSLASKSGLSLSNFDIGQASDKRAGSDQLALASESPVDSLDLSVSATGSYAAMKAFLKGAEWSLRPLDLVSLTVSDSKTGIYTYDLTFRIYWLR